MIPAPVDRARSTRNATAPNRRLSIHINVTFADQGWKRRRSEFGSHQFAVYTLRW